MIGSSVALAEPLRWRVFPGASNVHKASHESLYEDEIIRRISDKRGPRTMTALHAAFFRQFEEMME
jgi:hypothetical protein